MESVLGNSAPVGGAAGFVLSALDVAIILGSIALVVAVGLWASRRSNATARGYFLASDKLPWWIVGAAFVSTSVSSEQIVGTVGQAYEHGMGIANWEWWSLPTYTLLILIFIPVYLKNRVGTVPELLSKRFSPLCGDIYGWVMLLAYVILFLPPVLYSGSLAFAELTGWDFTVILWVLVAIVGVYTVKGGLSSVMWTDAVQCVMLLGGGIVLFFVALGKIPGGWDAMVKAEPQRFHLYHPPDDPGAPFLGLVCGSLGVFLFYQATNQVMIQRIFAARSTWDGIMGVIFAGFINLLRPLVTCFLGFIVYHWIHSMGQAAPLAKQDSAFTFALETFATGFGLRGIVLAGFLAAIMSTVSAFAHSSATIFALDVYRRLRPATPDTRLVRVGQVASILSLVLAAQICPLVARVGIFKYFQTGVTYLATPFISVFLLGILWKRANHQGALFGILGGLPIQAAAALAFPDVKLHWLYRGFIAQAIIMVGVAIVSLATAPPAPARWEPFVWRPALLARYDEGAARPWYQSLRLWFGFYVVIWAFIYWRFW